MCGICGFVAVRPDDLRAGREPDLREMLKALEHRGPDDWGIAWFGPAGLDRGGSSEKVVVRENPRILAGLGHRRLSIIDLSPTGHQPMASADHSLWVVLNGEIYNYLELRRELAGGYRFVSQSDTEVLLAAYARWGLAMLERLEGMYAFALWDNRRSTLLCARDPLGIKPFYFHHADDVFLFASEPRAVLKGLRTRGTMDADHAAEFLVLGLSDHDGGTFYREVRQLRGGEMVLLSEGPGARPAPRAFWSPGPCEPLPAERWDEAIRETLDASVVLHLRSDVPVGSCLSGGVDSGALVSTIAKVSGSPAQERLALTLCSPGMEGDESELARQNAAAAGFRWHGIEVDIAQLPADFRQMLEDYDEPFSSLGMFGQRKIMEAAHGFGLKVMMDGQGGDEIFLGYERYAYVALAEWARRGKFCETLREWTALRRHASLPTWGSLAGPLAFTFAGIRRRRNRARAGRYVEGPLLRCVRPEISAGTGCLEGGMKSFQESEVTRSCLPRLLRFEDRNSMRYAVEARVPFVTKAMVNLGLSLPLEAKIHGGWLKYALRRAVSDRVPEVVLWNPKKRGFEVPQKRWLDAARPMLEELVAGIPRDFPVSKVAVFADLDRGKGNSESLWRCLSLCLWLSTNGVSW